MRQLTQKEPKTPACPSLPKLKEKLGPFQYSNWKSRTKSERIAILVNLSIQIEDNQFAGKRLKIAAHFPKYLPTKQDAIKNASHNKLIVEYLLHYHHKN